MSQKSIAVIELVACAVLWSTAGIVFKFLNWNSFVISGYRSLIALFTVFAFLKITKRRFKIDKNAVLCGLSMFLTFSGFVAANKLTTSANAIVLQYTAPVFIIVICAFIYKDKFSKLDIAAVAATFFGIALFFFDRLDTSYILGNIIALGTGVTFAFTYVFQGKNDDESRMGGLIVGHLMTAAVGIMFSFFFPPQITASSIYAILFLGVFQLSIPYILLSLASSKCPPLMCSLISIIEPLLNPVWVFIFDGEAPGIFAFTGGALVIAVVVIWLIASSKKESKTL